MSRSTAVKHVSAPAPRPAPGGHRFRSSAFVYRNLLVYRHTWGVLVASVVEPLLYLLSIGVGVGHLIGHVSGLGAPDVTYTDYVAPALLATAVMNAAVSETTYSAFTRLSAENVYDAVIRTPLTPADLALGEILWAAARGLLSGGGFLAVMAALGFVRSPWALLTLPCAALVGMSFGALGLLAMTFISGWQQFQLLQLVMLPMFLLSTTFYPLSVYPRAAGYVVICLPLFPSITLLRGMALGELNPNLLWSTAYLLVIGLIGWRLATARLERRLIR